MSTVVARIREFFATRNLQAASGVSAFPRHGRPPSTAASSTGTLQNWNPRRLSTMAEAREREKIAIRAMDLEADDPHVSGLIESMNINTVGIGYTPQSRIRVDQVPATGREIGVLQRQAEWNFTVWSQEADIQGTKHFNDILLLADRCMLVRGEYLVLPRMIKRRGRTFSLALQVIDPLRLRTPSDKQKNENIIDGVEVDRNGRPVAYWIQKTAASRFADLSSKNFVRIRAWKGHRPQVLHGFIQKDPDQYRGYVFFAPAMKFFRDLSDHLDAELVSNIVTSAAALFIATPDPTQAAMAAAGGASEYLASIRGERYEEIIPGAVYYGNPGEKPEVIDHNRPGRNFVPFVETILRAAAACGGIPYEVAVRKYDQMNYSSARAALLDAWRVFRHRQDWECRHLAQPCWEMVQEEAFLRGMFECPEFYTHRKAYCQAQWIPQARGHVDPVKEIQAAILARRNNLRSTADLVSEMGGDWEATFEQIAKENARAGQLGLTGPETGTETTGVNRANDTK